MTEAHTQRAHARLAPSAAHRWMVCPGSIVMEDGLPEQRSVYAAEGTAAHELAALCLTTDTNAIDFLGKTVDTEHDDPANIFTDEDPDGVTRFGVTDEMVDAVQTYLDAVRAMCGRAGDTQSDDVILHVEERLDMTHLHPEIYGTGDAVLYRKKTRWLHVFDLKYGKGVVVSPDENPQLMLYGSGAVRAFHDLPIDGVTLHIVQPRAPGQAVKSWQTDILALMEFEQEIAAAAKRTDMAAGFYGPYNDLTDFSENWLDAGEHCRFCKAAPTCLAYRAFCTSKALAEFDDGAITLPAPNQLTPEQLAEVLTHADTIGNWVKAVQEFAHAEAVAGRTPPGFKLVPKRAFRKWRDEAEAKAALEMLGVEPLAEPKIKSPAVVEKEVGKKGFAPFSGLVTQQSSGTNLVPDSDSRPAVKTSGLLDFAPVTFACTACGAPGATADGCAVCGNGPLG